MVNQQTFHFSIGPVQGFISQSRRTRDLWCGSYLLSYLIGIALKAIYDNGGQIIYPAVDNNPLFKALLEPADVNKDDIAARVGSLPNRFKAQVKDPEKVIKIAQEAIDCKWQEIADSAWERLLSKGNIIPTEYTKRIWDRQINNLWEINWVIDVVDEEGQSLDMRKNLRDHFAEDEPGEKCTLCGERQALCEDENIDRKGYRESLRKLWKAIVNGFNEDKGYHFLRNGKERLCAVCLIKRILPLTTKKTRISPLGWEVHHNYPSTDYMAAVDWLKDVLSTAKDDKNVRSKLIDFIEIAIELVIEKDESAIGITGISNKIEELKNEQDYTWGKLADFRGDVFYVDRVQNEEAFPLKEDERNKLLSALKALTDSVKTSPKPFYAMLAMDSDNMGKLLTKYRDSQRDISDSLNKFTSQVIELVEEKHDGKVIYTGGDDVLALLPFSTALKCSQELKVAYLEAFKSIDNPELQKEATISAGIVYAHMTTPLQAVIKDVHSLLDDVAKDRLDRNAFAVRVWKRGGPILTFGKKWEKHKDGKTIDWINEIDDIEKKHTPKEGETRSFTSGFFYRFKDLIPIMEVLDSDKKKIQLLTAEYLKSREKLGLPETLDEKREEAETRVYQIYSISQFPDKIPNADGPLFIRFLVQKEI